MMENKTGSIQRKNMIWNTVAGMISASEAVIILAVVSRVNGLKDAGVLTLAFSIANLFMTIGKFGIKNYQVAHDGEDFSFRTFFVSRIVTVALMALVTFIYTVYCYMYSQYTPEKSLVIFFVCMWYAVEAFEDVYVGKYQAMGRLDIGSKLFSTRWTVTILVFIAADFVLKDIVAAAICALCVELVLGIFGIIFIRRKYKYGDRECVKGDRGIGALFGESVFLCVSSFLYYYMTNIPKYAINSYLGDEAQAIYGYISMPIFVITLLNNFIYQPHLTSYVAEWRENQVRQFTGRVIRQLLVIAVIMVVCLLGAYIVGIPVLSALYHQDLSSHKVHLMLLLLGGGLLAVGAFLSNMLTIMDRQKISMAVYAATSLTGYAVVNPLVKGFGLSGAVWGYMATMALLAVLFICVFARAVGRIKAPICTKPVD